MRAYLIFITGVYNFGAEFTTLNLTFKNVPFLQFLITVRLWFIIHIYFFVAAIKLWKTNLAQLKTAYANCVDKICLENRILMIH